MEGKTRNREYSDAIIKTKERIIVERDYSSFVINRSLYTTPENILLLNAINRKPLPNRYYDRLEQSIHEKQRHFDFLLHSIKQEKD